MLFLNGADIDRVVETSAMVDAIEEAYRIQDAGNFVMPKRMHVEQGENTLLLMPCFTDASLTTKLVTVNPENINIDKAVVNGLLILSDKTTGDSLALMDGAKLTAHRTGAVGGVAMRYLAGENAKTIGLVGAGVQGFHQLLYTCSERRIEETWVYDSNKDKLESFISDLGRKLKNVRIIKAESVLDLVKNADVIITATSSKEPVLPDLEAVYNGKIIIAMGSYRPDMREIPQKFFEVCDKIFVDTMHALQESGDIIDPYKNRWYRNELIPMADLLADKAKIGDNEQTILFKSVGMALFDNLAARYIYRSALENKIGTEIDL